MGGFVRMICGVAWISSFNLLVQMLPEQRDWRRFAHLPADSDESGHLF